MRAVTDQPRIHDSLPSRVVRALALGASGVLEPVAGRLGWPVRDLDREGLEAEAQRATGLFDFGDPYYGEGLDRLIQSLEADAKLHLIGRLYVRRSMLLALKNRLLLEEWRKRAPKVELNPPLVITGLPRSGTTLLHRLIGRQSGMRAPGYWELVRPLPNGAEDTEDARRRQAERELFWFKAVTPSMTSKHLITARSAEECIFALPLTFTTVFFWLIAPVDSYLDWYLGADLTKRYQDYRAILLALQARTPEETLVMKAPDHLGGLKALAAAVPEAAIVQLHRDPVEVVNSFNSLMLPAQNGTTRRRDTNERARINRDYLAREIERNRMDRGALGQRVFDVHYDDLVADPVKTTARILKHFGVKAGRRKLKRVAERQPQGKHGSHVYSGADFGLDDGDTRERFRSYIDAFGLNA